MSRTRHSFYGSMSLLLSACLLLMPFSQASLITTTSVPNFFDATHEVVCSCTCGSETQTYEWFPNFNCDRYNGIECSYGSGSTSHLADCVKKAQPKTSADPVPTDGLAAPGPASLPGGSGVFTSLSALTIAKTPIGPLPFPGDIDGFDILDGTEYVAWLNGISNNLFGSDFPGLVLPSTPNIVGHVYHGYTATTLLPMTIVPSSIQETESILGYTDPDSGEQFDIQVVWFTGTITANGTSVQTGMGASTVTSLSDPSIVVTSVLPLGQNYPFGTGWPAAYAPDAPAPATVTVLGDANDGLDGLFPSAAVAPAEGDPCDGCYTTANTKIKRMKRDLKSCIKWRSIIGGGVGCAVGLLAANPWTAAAGAIAGAGLGAGSCAETATNTYNDIIEDFCACLAANDCPPHHLCH